MAFSDTDLVITEPREYDRSAEVQKIFRQVDEIIAMLKREHGLRD